MGKRSGSWAMGVTINGNISVISIPVRFYGGTENFIEIMSDGGCRTGPRYDDEVLATIVSGILGDRPFWMWGVPGNALISRDFEGVLYFDDRVSEEVRLLLQKANVLSGFGPSR